MRDNMKIFDIVLCCDFYDFDNVSGDGYFEMMGECEKYWFYWEFWCFCGWNFDGWDGVLDGFLPYYNEDIGRVR